ncbi:MAG: hypothetical protein R3Y09_05665 [Clostridia bacterium]
MQIKIHRKHKIIEIFTQKTKILLDGGINLEENEVIFLKDVQEDLAIDRVDGIFLSHYKTDYVTTTKGLFEDVKFYAGELTASIFAKSLEYKSKKLIEYAEVFENRKEITVGDIKITPYLVDLPKYNGYMFLIQSADKSILYTGDYRANTRTSFQEVLAKLPKEIDVLICENCTISKFDINLVTEYDIKMQITEKIKATEGPVFVIQDVTDFDRAMSVFSAATTNDRVYLEDLYMAQIGQGAEYAMPNPVDFKNTFAYIKNGYREDHYRYKMFTKQARMIKTDLLNNDFVMNVRPSCKKYLKSLFQTMKFKSGLLILTVPYYMERTREIREFIEFMESKKIEVMVIKNSGHANAKAVKELANVVNPRKIVPIIASDASVLYKEYPNSTIIKDDEVWC